MFGNRLLERFVVTALCPLVLPALAAGPGAPTTRQVRVACLGDSITYGAGVEDRDLNHYPARLSARLGPGYEVANFGASGATLTRRGDYPYWDLPEFDAAAAFAPDIVVIMLGTNDSKLRNRGARGEFAGDLAALADHFAALPSRPKIWLCLPPPMFGLLVDFGVDALRTEILPRIRQVAAEKNTGLIDVYGALDGRADLVPDGVHPNAAGAAIIADTVFRAISAEQTTAPQGQKQVEE